MWWPRMAAKTMAKLLCFFLFLMLLIKLSYDYLTNVDEITSKIDKQDKWSYWINQAIPCFGSFFSLGFAAAHIVSRPLNHSKLQDKSTSFQLLIMFLTIFTEMINSLVPTKQLKFLINWLRRSEFTCWSVSSIITAYQEKYSFEKRLSLGKRFKKLNCVEIFESMDYWFIVLLLVELIIGTFEYVPVVMALLVYIRELIKINYKYIITSTTEVVGVLGIIKKILGVLGKIGITLLKFILRSFPSSVVTLHTYHLISYKTSRQLWAAAEVKVLAEFLSKARGFISFIIYRLNINYSTPN